MIKIIVSGITLPLPSETKITREFETTILNRELANSDFTYPFNIPLTDDVNQAFGFISEPANKTIKQSYDADLIIDDLHFQKVQVKVLKVSLKSKTVSISVLGNYTNIATLFGTKKVNELYLGGVRTIGDYGALPETKISVADNIYIHYYPSTSNVHIGQVVSGAITTDYVFGKAIDYGTDASPLTVSNGMSVLNAWDRSKGRIVDATLYNIMSSLRYDVATNPFEASERHFWVPFFRLGFFIKKCFEESGWSITTDLFTDAQFMNIVHYNTFSINSSNVFFDTIGPKFYINVVCRAMRIRPQDHAPRMSIIEFLNEVGKNYNLQYYYDFTSKKVTIRRLKNINSFAKNIDLTDVADPEPDISFADESDLKDGFNFEFEPDSYDSASGEDIDFDYNLIYRGSYTIPSALVTISAPAENNVAFVTSENKYYKFDGSEWIFYAHNLFAHKTTASENVVNVKSKCITMPMTDEVTTNQYYHTDGYSVIVWGGYSNVLGEICPYSNIGIEGRALYTFDFDKKTDSGSFLERNQNAYYTDDYLHGKEYYPHVILWLGYQASRTDSSGAYPYNGFAKVATVPYTCTGAYVPGYAQPWILPLIGISATKTGLIPDWWDLFVQMLVNSNVTLTQKVLFDILNYADIDFEKDYIWINNLRYLCTKAQINLPFPEVATLKLIKV